MSDTGHWWGRWRMLRDEFPGLSHRTVAVLLKAGVTAEQLLSMAPDQIRLLRGIGEGLLKEIEEYRARARRLGR